MNTITPSSEAYLEDLEARQALKWSTLESTGFTPWWTDKRIADGDYTRLVSTMLDRVVPMHEAYASRKLAIASPASCNAVVESMLGQILGEDAVVIAGDARPIGGQRESVVIMPMNAARMPFGKGTLDIIMDIEGAIWSAPKVNNTWRQVRPYKKLPEDIDATDIRHYIDEFARVLAPGGLLVIDDDPVELRSTERSQTGDVIRSAFGSLEIPELDLFYQTIPSTHDKPSGYDYGLVVYQKPVVYSV